MLPRMKAVNLLILGLASFAGAVGTALFVTTIQGAMFTLLITAGSGLVGCATATWILSPDRAEVRAADVREAAAAGLTIPEIATASRLSENEVRRILAT
ncbi:hypothetical protein SEA_DMITRI_37 [Gordonia phage Dmitri]|nr:hypothetical protein SEA_DMITRI_37 [Gordonia phage Dmitri]